MSDLPFDSYPLRPASYVATLGRTVIVIPHPDDEALGCGGLLAEPVIDTLKRDLRAATPAQPLNTGFRRVQVGDSQRASGAKFSRP